MRPGRSLFLAGKGGRALDALTDRYVLVVSGAVGRMDARGSRSCSTVIASPGYNYDGHDAEVHVPWGQERHAAAADDPLPAEYDCK